MRQKFNSIFDNQMQPQTRLGDIRTMVRDDMPMIRALDRFFHINIPNQLNPAVP
jgi:hypothetical protein